MASAAQTSAQKAKLTINAKPTLIKIMRCPVATSLDHPAIAHKRLSTRVGSAPY
jgi:hypothetical protein